MPRNGYPTPRCLDSRRHRVPASLHPSVDEQHSCYWKIQYVCRVFTPSSPVPYNYSYQDAPNIFGRYSMPYIGARILFSPVFYILSISRLRPFRYYSCYIAYGTEPNSIFKSDWQPSMDDGTTTTITIDLWAGDSIVQRFITYVHT